LTSPNSAKKAVAIVRPQPQQNNNNSQTSGSSGLSSGTTPNSGSSENIDRQGRISLYDFTSDSEESEDKTLPTGPVVKKDLKRSPKASSPFKKTHFPSRKLFSSSGTSQVQNPSQGPQTQSGSVKSFKKCPVEGQKTDEIKEDQSNPDPDNSSQAQQSNLVSNNAEKMHGEDPSSATAVAQHSGQQRSSPDSGVSSLRNQAGPDQPNQPSSDRSGSRSSTLSSSDDSLKAVKSSMGDRHLPQSSASAASSAPAAPTAPSASSGRGPLAGHHMPPTHNPGGQQPPHSAASLNYAAELSRQYHAAAAMQALSASSPSMAAQAQAAQLLAQYQQSIASSLTSEMILKNYPHLAAGGLTAPPHILGRSPEHLHLLQQQQQQRERDMAIERERQHQR